MTDQSVLAAPAVASVAELSQRLAAIQQALQPTDGLAYFNRMYQLVTQAVDTNIGANAFADPAWMTQLDVVFGNLYLDALRTSVQNPAAVPPAWGAVFERRADASLAPLQFALAGMNAHINRDLPVAINATCTQQQTNPSAGSHHADFFRVNGVLGQLEPTIRQMVEPTLLQDANTLFPGLQDLVGNFNMVKARETAWVNAETLWILQGLDAARATDYLNSLDHLTGFAGRGLLVRLVPTLQSNA